MGLLNLLKSLYHLDASQGHDTTAAAANWACHLIGSHPEIQKQLQEEVDSVLGNFTFCPHCFAMQVLCFLPGLDENKHITMEEIKELKVMTVSSKKRFVCIHLCLCMAEKFLKIVKSASLPSSEHCY